MNTRPAAGAQVLPEPADPPKRVTPSSPHDGGGKEGTMKITIHGAPYSNGGTEIIAPDGPEQFAEANLAPGQWLCVWDETGALVRKWVCSSEFGTTEVHI